jgi:hypothetical protein
MVLTDLPAILSSSWLTLWGVLAGAAILGAIVFWKVPRNRRPVVKVHALPEAPAHPDKAERTVKSAVQAVPKVTPWKAARDALEIYADPELIKARDYWSERFRTAVEKETATKQHIQDIRDKFPNGDVPKDSDAWPDLEQAERRLRSNEMAVMHTQEEVRRLWFDIHADLNRQFLTGELVAKGNREPPVEGSSEVRNPSAEWRALMLHLDGKAVQRGIDGKVVYSGVVIRKAVS